MSESDLPQVAERIVVCVDMWGSLATRTPIEDGATYVDRFADTDAHNQLVLRAFDDVRQRFSLSDARVLKMLGDGLLFAFPADQPIAALVFAVSILNKLAVEATNGKHHESAVALSCGLVSTQTCFVQGQDQVLLDIRGYPIDVAARLVSLATSGQILLCHGVKKRLGSAPIELREPCERNGFQQEFLEMIPAEVDFESEAPRSIRLPASGDPAQWLAVGVHQLVRRGTRQDTDISQVEMLSVVTDTGRPFFRISNSSVRRHQLLVFHDAILRALRDFDDLHRGFKTDNQIVNKVQTKKSLGDHFAHIEDWYSSLEMRTPYRDSEELRHDQTLRMRIEDFEVALNDLRYTFGLPGRVSSLILQPNTGKDVGKDFEQDGGKKAVDPPFRQGIDTDRSRREEFVSKAADKFEAVYTSLNQVADLCNGELRGVYSPETETLAI